MSLNQLAVFPSHKWFYSFAIVSYRVSQARNHLSIRRLQAYVRLVLIERKSSVSKQKVRRSSGVHVNLTHVWRS